MAISIPDLVASYPRARPPLSPDHAKVYAEQYRLNREGARPIENLAQRLERWMHRRVASIAGGPVLELGAGTLNHRRYEDPAVAYDVVEPFRELYRDSPYAAQVRGFYDAVAHVPPGEQYRRIISIAVLEHMEDLPFDVAHAALRLEPRGVFQAGIPSEGGFLWGLAWRCSTGVSYYLRTGLSYKVVMRHEHVNSAPEILALLRYLFAQVRVQRFPLPAHHASFYGYVEARGPQFERCRALIARARTEPSA